MGSHRRMLRLLALSLLTAVTLLQGVCVAAEELVIYSGRSDKFVRPVIEKFTEKTGIKVILHAAESTALLNKLRLEGDKTQADLYISNDAGNLQVGSNLKLFKSLPATIRQQIPAQFRAPDDTWIGLSARARVLVVNTNVPEAQEIKSVFDLAKPKWRARIGITNSSNESFIAGVTVYMLTTNEQRVKEWLTGLKDNEQGQVFAKHSHIVRAVARGKIDVGLVNHYYIYRHLAEYPDAPIKILLPDQDKGGFGVAWNVAGIAISAYTRQSVAAEQLVAYLVSEQGQSIFAEKNREYPTREGVSAAREIPPAGSYKVADIPMSKLAEYRNATIDLLENVGMP